MKTREAPEYEPCHWGMDEGGVGWEPRMPYAMIDLLSVGGIRRPLIAATDAEAIDAAQRHRWFGHGYRVVRAEDGGDDVTIFEHVAPPP